MISSAGRGRLRDSLLISEELYRYLSDFGARSPSESRAALEIRLTNLERELYRLQYPDAAIHQVDNIEKLVDELLQQHQHAAQQGDQRSVAHWASTRLNEIVTAAIPDVTAMEMLMHAYGRLAELEYETIVMRVLDAWIALVASTGSIATRSESRPYPD